MNISELLSYSIPSLITGGIAYYFFSSFLSFNAKEKQINIITDRKKKSLPIKLQAYERMLLFCDRINPIKLQHRINPIGNDSKGYLLLLTANIEQEFEHNMVQQIYISDASWTAIVATKIAIINKLNQLEKNCETAQELRENILLEYKKAVPTTDTAISILKTEVKKLL